MKDNQFDDEDLKNDSQIPENQENKINEEEKINEEIKPEEEKQEDKKEEEPKQEEPKPEENSEQDMIAGKFKWHIYLGAIIPGESLEFRLEYDSKYLKLLFQR